MAASCFTRGCERRSCAVQARRIQALHFASQSFPRGCITVSAKACPTGALASFSVVSTWLVLMRNRVVPVHRRPRSVWAVDLVDASEGFAGVYEPSSSDTSGRETPARRCSGHSKRRGKLAPWLVVHAHGFLIVEAPYVKLSTGEFPGTSRFTVFL